MEKKAVEVESVAPFPGAAGDEWGGERGWKNRKKIRMNENVFLGGKGSERCIRIDHAALVVVHDDSGSGKFFLIRHKNMKF
jgi:hypothetical protein